MSDQLDTMQEFAQEVQEVIEQQPVSNGIMQESPKQESSKEINARILRERAEAAERRAAELEYQIKLQQQQQAPRQVVEEEDDGFDISDDAYVEGHQVKKYLKKLNQKVTQAARRFEEETQRNAMNYAESSLRNQFNDFEQVVTKENLEKLSRTKAPLFRSIMSNQDIYDRGYSAYEAIKNLGILDNSYEQVDRKLEENRQRPRSAASAPAQTAETPLSRVGDYDRRVLTEERKAQIRRQVEEAKRNRF
jgi:hypothetical protein